MDLPGIDREALEIDIDDNRLVVKGTRAIASRSNIALKDREESSCARSVFRVQSIRRRSQRNTKTAFCRSPAEAHEQKPKRIDIKIS